MLIELGFGWDLEEPSTCKYTPEKIPGSGPFMVKWPRKKTTPKLYNRKWEKNNNLEERAFSSHKLKTLLYLECLLSNTFIQVVQVSI